MSEKEMNVEGVESAENVEKSPEVSPETTEKEAVAAEKTEEPVKEPVEETAVEEVKASKKEEPAKEEVKASKKEEPAKKEAKATAKKEPVKAEEEVSEPETEQEKPVVDEVEATEVVESVPAPKAEKKATAKKEPVSDENSSDTGFDWEAFEEVSMEATKGGKSKYEELYDKTLSTVAELEVTDGTVIMMNTREVVINIGYKSEGVVSLNEFRYNPDLKVGDTVEVYVESKEDKKGQLILSHKKARSMRSWDRVNAALDNDEVIKGFIKCRTKGGMIVDVFGIEAFLPGSQIDVKPIRDYDAYVSKTMEFKVVKINHEFKNVVVSHKALIEEELEAQKKEIIAKLEKGQVLEGTVKNITSYGVFIDLGGVDGLIHITDLSWGRVNHPEEIVQLDQKLNVVILDFDDDKKRIALGLKQLSAHPWDSLDEKLSVGDKVKGKVVVMADYGAFVEIAAGVEGLIHVSEMSWSQHLRSAQEFLKVGDEIEATILTLDREERKMSLGIKQLREDPWEQILEKYAVGTKHAAKVRNFTNFGIFVEIEEGVDGLIHISDLSWTKKIKHPAEFTNIGDSIDVSVLEIDKENRRLSLGHKQLEENPWDTFETVFEVGSVHEGTIIEYSEKGAVIALPYGVEGFATPKHLVKEDGSKVKSEDRLSFKVIEFSKSAKKIIVSHSRIFEDEQRPGNEADNATVEKQTKAAPKKVRQNAEKTTLGDITDLAALKTEMEENAKKKAENKKENK